jgi:uncharacterized protein YndB with AHSA1/START domain
MNTDRIEKKVVLKAPRERVWRAISDSRQFGVWFGAALDGSFAAGQWIQGRIKPTEVDPDVARMQQPHAGTPMHLFIESIEPMERLAFRWHPYAIGPDRDYAKEPTTLVTFTLSDAEGGTLLTISESGFDRLPPDRRESAFTGNEEGWTHQCKLVAKYLARAAGV